jgi:hypothetical protein
MVSPDREWLHRVDFCRSRSVWFSLLMLVLDRLI